MAGVTKRQATLLAGLIERVKAATAARGKKSALARWLGTTPQCVTDWLAGRRAPGGEVTLLLLEWVQSEEPHQNKNTPAALVTPPRRKTRLRKSSRENQKSGPKRR